MDKPYHAEQSMREDVVGNARISNLACIWLLGCISTRDEGCSVSMSKPHCPRFHGDEFDQPLRSGPPTCWIHSSSPCAPRTNLTSHLVILLKSFEQQRRPFKGCIPTLKLAMAAGQALTTILAYDGKPIRTEDLPRIVYRRPPSGHEHLAIEPLRSSSRSCYSWCGTNRETRCSARSVLHV